MPGRPHLECAQEPLLVAGEQLPASGKRERGGRGGRVGGYLPHTGPPAGPADLEVAHRRALGRLSPLGRRDDGNIVRAGPLREEVGAAVAIKGGAVDGEGVAAGGCGREEERVAVTGRAVAGEGAP